MGSKKKNRSKQRKSKQKEKKQEQAFATIPADLEQFARDMIESTRNKEAEQEASGGINTNAIKNDAGDLGVEVAHQIELGINAATMESEITESGSEAIDHNTSMESEVTESESEAAVNDNNTSMESAGFDTSMEAEADVTWTEVEPEPTSKENEESGAVVVEEKEKEENTEIPEPDPVEEESKEPEESELPEDSFEETLTTVEKEIVEEKAKPESIPAPDQPAGTPTKEPEPPQLEEKEVEEPPQEKNTVEPEIEAEVAAEVETSIEPDDEKDVAASPEVNETPVDTTAVDDVDTPAAELEKVEEGLIPNVEETPAEPEVKEEEATTMSNEETQTTPEINEEEAVSETPTKPEIKEDETISPELANVDPESSMKESNEDTSDILNALPKEEAAPVTATTQKKKRGSRRQSFTDFMQKANSSMSESGHESFTNIALKPSGNGSAIKSGQDVVKHSESANLGTSADFSEVKLKQAPAIEKPAVQPRRASFIGMALKPSEEGDMIKSGRDVIKDSESVMDESQSELSEVQLKQAPKLEKPAIRPRRASYIDVSLKKSEGGDAIKSGGDVVKDAASVISEPSVTGISEVQLKHAITVEKKAGTPRRASYIGIQLKKSGNAEVLKAGGDPSKAVHDTTIDTATAETQESTGKAEKLQSGAGWGKIRSAVVKPAVVGEPAKPAFAGFKLKTTGKVETLMPEKTEKDEKGAGWGKIRNSVVRSSVVDGGESGKPAFAGFQLKSTGKAKKLMPGAELNTKKDKEIDSPEAGDVEIDEATVEAPNRPAFAGFQLKSTGKADELVQKDIERTSKQIERNPEPVVAPEEPGKPAFAGFKLKSTGNADTIKAGLDVGKGGKEKLADADKKSTKKPYRVRAVEEEKSAYGGLKLKSTGKADAQKAGSRSVSPVRGATAENPAFAGLKLKKAAPIEKPKEDTDHIPETAFAGIKLKGTDKSAAIKSGGDIAKSETKSGDDSQPFAGVQLKKAPKASSAPVTKPEEAQPFASVNLKKAAPKISATPVSEEAQPFASVQLKKAAPKRTTTSEDDNDEPKPFASVQLKKAEPITTSYIENEESQPFASVHLKKAAQKPDSTPKDEEDEQPFASVHLKKAEPVATPEFDSEEAKPFASVHLKKAVPKFIEPEGDEEGESQPKANAEPTAKPAPETVNGEQQYSVKIDRSGK